MNKKLGKQEWIVAGLRALGESGVEAVRVERLAAALGVTKGSFYWHFKDREALLEAMFTAWSSQAANAIIDQVEDAGGDAGARLHMVLKLVAQRNGLLDCGMRAWAAKSDDARNRLDEVDRRRLAYLESLFAEMGFSPAEAKARARLVYQSFIGQFAMRDPLPVGERLVEWLEIIHPMLVRRDNTTPRND